MQKYDTACFAAPLCLLDLDFISNLEHAYVFVLDEKNQLLYMNETMKKLIYQSIMNVDFFGGDDSVLEQLFLSYFGFTKEYNESEDFLSTKMTRKIPSTFHVPNLLKIDFYTIKLPISNYKNYKSCLLFISFKKKEVDLKTARAYKLSGRELECICLALQNLTMDQIAKVLYLSPRTVQYYFENIKNKLGCENKMKLLEKIESLRLVQLFNLE